MSTGCFSDPELEARAVKIVDREFRWVETLQTSKIYGDRGLAVLVGSTRERPDPAMAAKEVVNMFMMELVIAERVLPA